MPNYNSDKGSKGTQSDNEKSKTGKSEQGQSKTGMGQNKQPEKQPFEKSKDDQGMGQTRK